MTRALAVALCLAAVPALAFEGVIETKMTMNRSAVDPNPGGGGPTSMTGSGVITVKGLNSRMEQQMAFGGMGGGKTIVIHRADDPKTTYILNDANKTYSKHTVEKDDESEVSKWTVKKLGKDTVAGRSTEHVLVQREGGGDALDVWIDKNLVSAGDLEKAFNAGGRGQSGWWGALRKEGVAGVPLKVVSKNSKGETAVTWEATSVKSQSVPDSAFAIPSGYTESKGGYGGMVPPSAERRDQMLQNLTPEQRKQVEEMMKQHGGGAK